MKVGFGYLATGIGIGAAISVLFTPRSGEEIRGFLANKCFDAIGVANEKVWRARLRVRDMINRGQEEISKAIEAGREAFGKPKPTESPVTVL
jgi:gas vesicle protein